MEHHYNAVFTDVKMPEIDGLEAAKIFVDFGTMAEKIIAIQIYLFDIGIFSLITKL